MAYVLASQVERETSLERTVMAEMPHSVANLGINLCATFLSCLIPVLNFTVKGISPNILFIPTRIFPS